MRLRAARLRRMFKGNLHVEFVRQDLTSYSRAGVVAPLPAAARAAVSTARGLRGHRRRL